MTTGWKRVGVGCSLVVFALVVTLAHFVGTLKGQETFARSASAAEAAVVYECAKTGDYRSAEAAGLLGYQLPEQLAEREARLGRVIAYRVLRAEPVVQGATKRRAIVEVERERGGKGVEELFGAGFVGFSEVGDLMDSVYEGRQSTIDSRQSSP